MQLSNLTIVKKIKQLPCFAEQICEVKTIEQGLSGHNFKVTTYQEDKQAPVDYFVKWFKSPSEQSQVEVSTTRFFAQQGLSPQVLFSSQDCLVSRFVAGGTLQTHWEQGTLSKDICLKQTARLLATLHKVVVGSSLETFDMSSLLNTLLNNATLLSSEHELLIRTINQLPKLQSEKSPVVCHGDANFSNVLKETQHQFWLIDFECSILTDAEFDIAMSIAINLLDESAKGVLMQEYQKLSAGLLDVDLVDAYLPYCYLINALWFIAKAKCAPHATGLGYKAKEQLLYFDKCANLPVSLQQALNAYLIS